MWESIANGLVLSAGIYGAIGLVFALFFVTRGVNRVDPVASAGTWGFRCLIFPGSAALWPLMLMRWIRADSFRPVQQDAHRNAAKGSGAGR